MTIGSLFSGIGGLELGLEACGLGPVIWQAESDPYARAVLAKHWPGVKCYEDVKEIDAEAERPDIICGGFPCQDISNAGKRAGIDGPKSGLWSEFARIVRVVRPRFVFVENVAALANRGLDRILGDLAALGFDAEWGVFRASDVGAPHRRERLFILAYRAGVAERESTDETHAVAVERDARAEPRGGGVYDLADTAGARRERTQDVGANSCNARENRRGGGESQRDGRHRFPPGPDRIAGWDGPKPAVRRGSHGLSRRVDRLRCLGNAVVPQQAALAFTALMARAA